MGYGSGKPIHISYDPEQKGEFVEMRLKCVWVRRVSWFRLRDEKYD
jgi:hypothetical protein